MVDLKGQYQKIENEINQAVLGVFHSTQFINGREVDLFASELAAYTGALQVIPCANGTDALQIALMALALNPGDEVIVPAFTYAATAEVIALLRLEPVLIDVDPDSFTLNTELLESVVTPKTRAIIPVHLFGQCAAMEEIMAFAVKHGISVVEDNAQAIGAQYTFGDGSVKQSGTIGHIGTTSFFPSKNLGCYGDGGALFTNDPMLAERIRMIANHGQRKKYYHEMVGVNSRLDTVQAAILRIKLKHLNEYAQARIDAAKQYDQQLAGLQEIKTPVRVKHSTHVFHQYTLKLPANKRDGLKDYLGSQGIPSAVYYPLPIHLQQAFASKRYPKGSFPVSEQLCAEVLSLPIHTEITETQIQQVCDPIRSFMQS